MSSRQPHGRRGRRQLKGASSQPSTLTAGAVSSRRQLHAGSRRRGTTSLGPADSDRTSPMEPRSLVEPLKRNEPPVEAADTASWKRLLDDASHADLWDGVRRQDRPGWNDWLDAADKLTAQPRTPLPAVCTQFVDITITNILLRYASI